MSLWTARLIAEGGQTSHGDHISRTTLESLVPLLPGVPLCLHWIGEGVGHPLAASNLAADVDEDLIVGTVGAVRLFAGGIFGLVSIGEPHVDLLFLNAERRGRLVETLGLSVYGRAVTLPPDYGESLLWFNKMISVDIVDIPLGGGHLLQSDAAEAGGRPLPALPKVIPASRPARESRGAPPLRYAPAAQLETPFRIIREGADY